MSPAIERVLGYEPEERIGSTPFDLVHPDDVARVRDLFAKKLRSSGDPRSIEVRMRHRDGYWRHIESTGTNLLDDPSVRGFVLNSRDVTERKALEEQLRHQAFHDPLTGLPNRALFMNRLEQTLAGVGRREGGVAVLFVDLNNFKVVNDSLGHEAGDRLLVAVSDRLRKCLRPADTAARFGGDEFVILLRDVGGATDATCVAERITEELMEAPFDLDGHEVFTTPSIGIAVGDSAHELPEGLLRRADAAMYHAKEEKAHHQVFDPSMSNRAMQRLRLENDLRRAIAHDEFRVCYQPQVLLETGRIVGVEALVRWEHPERGLLSPEEFVPVAENTGMIVPIGWWVLEQACRQAKEWHERYPTDPPLMMCVNLSARQFQRPGLVQDVAGVLRETGIEPRSLELEITESVLMKHGPATVATLRELEALGMQLALDDFGTGYSSMSYLRRFPIKSLKLDRSFVGELEEGPESRVILSAMTGLARALGIKAIAEGVETAEQVAQLQEMGCKIAQGNYFWEPLSSEEASALLATALRG